MEPVITAHAIARCIERVPGCTDEASARRLLACRAVRTAIGFGARTVKLGTGQHVVIRDGCVITVLPRETTAWYIAKAGERR